MSRKQPEKTPHQPAKLDPLSLPLSGQILIEASAGTGKTFTIALLYVRLVLGQPKAEGGLTDGLLPPDILVVTFTDAATKELRDRIRARLTQAAEVFSEHAAVSAHTDALFRLRDEHYSDPVLWPECRKKLLLAAEWMDEAAVSTIHGWCHRMLSEHAFDSGNLFRLTLQADQTELLTRACEDYWRTFIYPLSDSAAEEFSCWWRQPHELLVSVRSLLGKFSTASDDAGDVEQRIVKTLQQQQQQVDALKQQPWSSWHGEVEELLNQLQQQKRLNGNSKNSMLKAWSMLLQWSQSDIRLPEGLDKAGLINQTPEGLARIVKGDEDVPQHPAFTAIGDLQALARNMPSARSAVLRHACCWIEQRLEHEKQLHSQMGFDDLLLRLDQALRGHRGEQLATTIRQQFPVALVDEFQDTDPVQYRIFQNIYAEASPPRDVGCFLMIGDPKQAIYGFRGADIFTYLSARQLVDEKIFTLASNYRSAPAMVDAVNHVFSYADQHCGDGAFLFGQGEQSQLPFLPVDAKLTDQYWCCDEQEPASLVFYSQRSDSGKDLSKGDSQQQLAIGCASEIARLLVLGQQSRAGFKSEDELTPLAPHDIAVLVNNRSEAQAVRQALTAYGVKSVYLSDRDSVLQCQEALELLSWLRACAEPSQLAYIRAALATPSLGLDWQSLDALLSDELQLERTIERFIRYQQLWQRQGVLPMLRRLLMDYEVPARLLSFDDGERRLTDILHLAELLQQDSQQLEGEQALLRHYRQLLLQADDEHEHRTVRLESDAGLVKVVTVHKSKGLEYPLVFLPFATHSRSRPAKVFLAQYHDEQGQLRLVFDPTEADLEKAERERLGEEIRKLYVALTRARFATWVGAPTVSGWQDSALGYLVANEDLEAGLQALSTCCSAIAVQPLPEPAELRYQPQAQQQLGDAHIALRQTQEDWWIASYSSLEYSAVGEEKAAFRTEFEQPQQQNLADEADANTEINEPDNGFISSPIHQFPRGAQAGTFLHELLEWCADFGFGELLKGSQPLQEIVAQRCLTLGWQEWQSCVYDWLLQLLQTPLPLPDGEVTLAQLQQYQVEMEFWFESENVVLTQLDLCVSRNTLASQPRASIKPGRLNGMLKGFIDLVFEYQGRYYVLDYKSNHLGDNDYAYNDQAMAQVIIDKRYDLQYMLYLLALHRLLKARLPNYDYDRDIGGAVYVFLRGVHSYSRGVFIDKPERCVIESLDALFAGVTSEPLESNDG